jgi:hypothetical protein
MTLRSQADRRYVRRWSVESRLRIIGLHVVALPISIAVIALIIVGDELRQGKVTDASAFIADLESAIVFGSASYALAAIPIVLFLLAFHRIHRDGRLRSTVTGSLLAILVVTTGVYVGLRLVSVSVNNTELRAALWTTPVWPIYGAVVARVEGVARYGRGPRGDTKSRATG